MAYNEEAIRKVVEEMRLVAKTQPDVGNSQLLVWIDEIERERPEVESQ
jgi:hypothetical protein